ncbi:Uncharacterized protein APZ42_032984 [Daphnia magna]|uniref:Uncharacterized protein n=1 Tax=Daphnia magna TaxID=35525 RepID=A0A164LI63_9CRUS|nr:Uncharacterized protein APZ42_032984 [Daphnia magna]
MIQIRKFNGDRMLSVDFRTPASVLRIYHMIDRSVGQRHWAVRPVWSGPGSFLTPRLQCAVR